MTTPDDIQKPDWARRRSSSSTCFPDPRAACIFDLAIDDDSDRRHDCRRLRPSPAGRRSTGSDMLLDAGSKPPPSDPFFAQTTLAHRRRSRSRRPAGATPAARAASPKAEAYAHESLGVGDTAYFGPEAEFFIFDDVRFDQA